MSISIYNPYFYIIQHINSGRYYAGVKYARDSNPDNLLKPGGYQTSSNIIKQIILEEGLDAFAIRKIKVFETAEQALNYELRFLRRINASFNDSFLNRTNNSFSDLNVDYEKSKQTCLEKYGCEYALQSEEVKEKRKQTCLEKYGVDHPNKLPELKERFKQTCLERYGVESPLQSPEVKEKIKQTLLKNYGVEHNSQTQVFKEKYKQTCLDRFGVEHPSQSEEVREKSKQTCLENLGVENPSQSEDVKEKKKQTCLNNLGVEHPSQSPEIQEKKRQNRIILNNRPTVLLIKKYKEQFNPKLIPHWFCKSQEILDSILEEFKITYGEIIDNQLLNNIT